MTSSASRVCRLLQLPGELRNRIYRDVLLDVQRLKVPQIGFHEPGLLRTCRAIRKEAEPIFLLENKFYNFIVDHDAVALEPLAKKCVRVKKQYGARPDIAFSMQEAPNWPNLLQCLKEVQQRRPGFAIPLSFGAQDSGLLGVERQLLGTMFDYAEDNKNR